MCGSGCVGIYNFKPNIEITNIQKKEGTPDIYDVEAVIHYQPQTWVEKWGHTFQTLIKVEKAAQVANELHHLFGAFARTYVSTGFYRTLNGIHDGAHSLHELLHSITFISDFCAILSGRFVAYQHDGRIDYLLTGSRVLHFTSHCLAPVLQFIDNPQLRHLRSGLIIGGSAGAVLSTLQHRDKNSASDLTINLSSIAFEVLSYFPKASPWQSLAGIVQGIAILRRLSLSDETIKVVYNSSTRSTVPAQKVHAH